MNIDNIKCYTYNTVVIGSGAAGFNSALQLKRLGNDSVALVTEGVKMGTSRNTGSDKQTYYKMNLCGDFSDSPSEMAKDLFAGKAVDGDVAYAEAALSSQCFLQLAYLGVPFPTNRYGEYVGYKTDHDNRARATSAGPLTSKLMTEQLENAVLKAGVKIIDKCMAISVIKNGGTAVGLLCLSLEDDYPFVLFRCKNIIFATGGPAGIYADTVYPFGHSGSSGIALEAGVTAKNLTEWQFGLASVNPRWNVSGTYMQVLPRFVSVDENGKEYDFLDEYYADSAELLSQTFKKGYEWPFDCRKLYGGSSVIDLLVYCERVLKNRRVYLDFMKNPCGLDDLPFDKLKKEAFDYLKNADACFGTPIERLIQMNEPAYMLYKEKGVDLKCERLEIALCAQHNNGGLDVDLWWRTNIEGIFAVGEVAGSHGVYRPGGSALNAGQVGSLRAAQYICEKRMGDPIPEKDFFAAAGPCLEQHMKLRGAALGKTSTVEEITRIVTSQMTRAGGAIRELDAVTVALADSQSYIKEFENKVKTTTVEGLRKVYRLRDLLYTQCAVLTAFKDYMNHGGKSRGSAIYCTRNGKAPDGFDNSFAFLLDSGEFDSEVQNIRYNGKEFTAEWRSVRPLPEGGGFFETVWKAYRENKNVF